jgi:hypothetical protein
VSKVWPTALMITPALEASDLYAAISSGNPDTLVA